MILSQSPPILYIFFFVIYLLQVPIISTLKQTFNRSKPQKNKDDKQLHITRKRKKALKQHLQIVADL